MLHETGRALRLRDRTLDLTERARVMAILNVTPAMSS
jgi:hypothetical protein